MRRIMLLVAQLLVLIAGLELASLLLHTELVKNREEVAVLGVAAFLVILSGPLAHLLSVPVAVVELILGMIAAFYGIKETEGVKILAEIGANMVLFMAGAEIDIALLRRRAGDSIVLGSLISVFPLLIVPLLVGTHVNKQFILVSASLVATSVALTYAILQSTGLIKTKAGQSVLAAAMISDVTGIILLNIATAGRKPYMLLYSLIILVAIALYPVLNRVSHTGFELEIRLITMAILILGVASDIIGIHSVLTSFILGVIVAETIRERRHLREKLEGMAFGFFAPFFFVSSGLKVNPEILLSNLLLILLVGFLVFSLKFFPSLLYVSSKLSRSRRASIAYASSIAPLLTVSIIAADVGLKSQIISDSVYTLIMGSVILTSLLAGVFPVLFKASTRHVHEKLFP